MRSNNAPHTADADADLRSALGAILFALAVTTFVLACLILGIGG